MSELKIIENDLVPVYETDKGVKVVNGRELHQVLQSGQDFSTWVKKRLAECDAEENKDFSTAPQIYGTANGGHSTRTEYIILLDTAKEMAMLERNEKGKQVRKYFIAVEEKYKQTVVNMSELSPELQMFNQIFTSVAQQQLEQKRLAEKQEQIEHKVNAVVDTFQKTDDEEDFKAWCKRCISKIVNIGNYTNGKDKSELFRNAWNESFERLNQKRPCKLKQRVVNAKGIALDNGKTKTWIEQNINNLSVISGDKDLRPAYESVMREMMIYYCVS